MNKRVLFVSLLAMFTMSAHGGQIASVKYIQSVIRDIWSDFGDAAIVRYRLGEENRAVNMKWLLYAVDIANKNMGTGKTDYSTMSQATLQVADTIVVEQAVKTLIKPNTIYIETNGKGYFEFIINADGDFEVICGDGSRPEVKKGEIIYCNKPSTNKIQVTGTATGYGSTASSVISFTRAKARIIGVEGSFAGMFPVIDGVQPIFNTAFYNCSGLKYISDTVFANLYGVETLRDGTFAQTFLGTALEESVKLFGQPLYDIWPNATSGQVGDMYKSVSAMSDAASVPEVWK